MIMELFCYYFFCASCVFVYGVGLKQVVLKSISMHYFISSALKSIFVVFLSIAPVWFLTSSLLTPKNLAELYPILLCLIVLVISRVVEIAFKFFNFNVSGILLSLAITFLALNESLSLQESYVIACAALVSIVIIIPIMYAIRKRSIFSTQLSYFKMPIIVFFSVAILFFVFYTWNISWFNQVVLK